MFIKSMCEADVDALGSVKQGKKTNQLRAGSGRLLREWSGALEVPLSNTLQAFSALGLKWE